MTILNIKEQLPVIVLFVASVLWGLTWLPLKAINATGIDGIALIFFAYAILAVVLSPLLIKQFSIWKEHKKMMFLIALLGGGANLAFTYALINGEVIRVMVLFYLLPVWGVAGGRIFLKEKIDSWRYLGVTLAIAGAFIILGGFEIFNTPPSWIDLVALVSGLFFSMNNLLFRAAQSIPVSSKLGIMFLGCFTLAGTLLLSGVEELPTHVISNGWIMLIMYTLFWLLLANIGSQWSVTHMEAGRSSIIMIFELIAAVASATIIAHESMSTFEYIGGSLIMAAASIEAFRTKDDDIPTIKIEL
ncbi:EamA family transporter [Sulfurimonas aquatica]|uniref:EamA family transporter n=1 Tax=Sulfurimonas aquatica TaxID=2672570 RepID=A0A975GBH0_9BACT|nr:DMT family transporter [Sulfurimonas aquatica]QSZ40656.1 EamA family transporter [Sulfurimonas aquatica]